MAGRIAHQSHLAEMRLGDRDVREQHAERVAPGRKLPAELFRRESRHRLVASSTCSAASSATFTATSRERKPASGTMRDSSAPRRRSLALPVGVLMPQQQDLP
jgi:hypothetical protein